MTPSRRAFMWMAALGAGALAVNAQAQFGRGRRGDPASMPSPRAGETKPRVPPPPSDPLAAVERELPSLRIDLKLTSEQTPLFDGFERQVRNAAEAGRWRARHVIAYRTDDGSTVTANVVLSTIANDDTQRADAARQALERMTALYAALNADQRKQLDRRIVEALRDPLGGS